MELWIQLLQHSLIGAAAILLITIFSVLTKGKYQYKYKKYIWFIISIWLLIPCTLLEGTKKIVIQIPQIHMGQTVTKQVNSDEKIVLNHIVENTKQKESKVDNSYERLLYNLVFWVWIFGVVIMLLYFGLSYVLTYTYITRRSMKCEKEEMLSAIKSISTICKMKKTPQLYLLKDVNFSPFTIGLFNKKIFLPDREYIQKDLQYIITHEIVHCKERDISIKLLAILVNIIHWFNPFVWLMVKSVEQDIELNCDEIVLKKKDLNERKEYSEIIMSYIQTNQPKKFRFSSFYVNNTRFIKRRFQNIYDTKNRKNGFIFCICLVMFLIIGSGSIEINQTILTPFIAKLPIDFGFEIRTDVNGDGKYERVYVKDNRSGDYAFTQLSTEINDESRNIVFIDFEGYWSSYIVSGDLSGNGGADIVLVRISTGSTYGGGVVNVLHLENGKWIPYPSNFIKNSAIPLSQPENFREENFDVSCLGATIIEDTHGLKLRLILNEDIINDTVKCVDCSYQDNGWYIENIEIISNYYRDEKDRELLKNNFFE